MLRLARLRSSIDRRAAWAGLVVLLAVIAVEGLLLLARDLSLVRNGGGRAALRLPRAEHAQQRQQEQERQQRQQEPPPPKVGLMFLTRGPMPYEPLWRSWLERMTGDAGAGGEQQQQQQEWRRYFSLVAHVPRGFAFPQGSLFAGAELPEAQRVNVSWGQHSVVEAERALMRAALADPSVAALVLLSESCAPIWPAAAAWMTLAAEGCSRVNACANASDPGDDDARMAYRWQPAMGAAGVARQHWRKSSQWVALRRRHAEAVVADGPVNDVFARECYVDNERNSRFCVSDEHAIPTLLAVKGLTNETACNGVVTRAWWDGPYFHPHTYGAGEATGETLAKLRGDGCTLPEGLDPRAALRRVAAVAAAAAAVNSTSRTAAAALERDAGLGWEKAAATGRAETGGSAGVWASALVQARAPLLQPQCPLFARKMAGEAVQEWSGMLRAKGAVRRR